MESQWVNFLGLGIPLLVAAVTAVLAYWREQRLKRIEQQQEREEAVRRYKQELYSSLQLSVFNIWAAKGIAKREVEALCKISDAWIFASDTVLRQVNLFDCGINVLLVLNLIDELVMLSSPHDLGLMDQHKGISRDKSFRSTAADHG